jgi:hypothetical protein
LFRRSLALAVADVCWVDLVSDSAAIAFVLSDEEDSRRPYRSTPEI